MLAATQINGNFYPEELMQPKRKLKRLGGLSEGCKAAYHPLLVKTVLFLLYMTTVIDTWKVTAM